MMEMAWKNDVFRDGACCVISAVCCPGSYEDLEALAPISAAMIFSFPLITWFYKTHGSFDFQFCSPPGQSSTICIKCQSLFLNTLSSSSEFHWDEIQLTVWRHVCLSHLIGKLYSRMLSSKICDTACLTGSDNDLCISNKNVT